MIEPVSVTITGRSAEIVADTGWELRYRRGDIDVVVATVPPGHEAEYADEDDEGGGFDVTAFDPASLAERGEWARHLTWQRRVTSA